MAKSKVHARRAAKLRKRCKRLKAEVRRQDRIMRTFGMMP